MSAKDGPAVCFAFTDPYFGMNPWRMIRPLYDCGYERSPLRVFGTDINASTCCFAVRGGILTISESTVCIVWKG